MYSVGLLVTTASTAKKFSAVHRRCLVIDVDVTAMNLVHIRPFFALSLAVSP